MRRPSPTSFVLDKADEATIAEVDGQDQQTLPGTPSDDSDEGDGGFNYLSGWKLHASTIGLGIALFLINLEITIVSTAIVAITDDLQNFSRSNWIITAYLCTFVAGLVIWAKASDLLGRKWTILASLFIFAAFSAGCGAAQTMTQLIICRALQGVGGAGVYSIAIAMTYQLVPERRYPLYTAIVMALVALSFASGPIFGGLIAQNTTWRWVFFLNVPCAGVSGLTLLLYIPHDFPYQGLAPGHVLKEQSKQTGLRNLDVTGSFLMAAAVILLITGLNQAASLLSWTDSTVLGPICSSAVAWVAFVISQWHVSRPGSRIDPVFPWRLMTNRVMMGLLLTSICTGTVSLTCIFLLPLRYQTTVSPSPLQAGLRLIPFSVCGPIGTIMCAALSKNRRVPPLYMGIAGALLQLIGIVLLSRGDPNDPEWPALYGIQVIIGLGFGGSIAMSTLICPFIVSKQDIAVGSSSVVQSRYLGSAVVIAIITAVGNTWLRDELMGVLTPSQIQKLFQSVETIDELPPSLQTVVRGDFVLSFNLQTRIVLGFAVAAVFTCLLMWQKTQVRVP
ncbi:drug resistance transporter [Thozetella sp. PMI_491]|nr:drug resistance transporter [Thozetella sp. PMI_491]